MLTAKGVSAETLLCGSFAVSEFIYLKLFLSSVDLNGIDLTPVQDTPVASRKEDTYVHFNVDIELQKHVEKLTKGWFVMVNIGFLWPGFSSCVCVCTCVCAPSNLVWWAEATVT